MKLTIHRGTKEIGGSCIELVSGSSKILLDFGMPLVDSDKNPFDSDIVKKVSFEQLITDGILPNLQGFYKGTEPQYEAVLLSHPHQDHYGLLSFVNPEIPIYLSQGCKELIEISHFFGQTDCALINYKVIEMWNKFEIGSFSVTPYLVDHSGFDAVSYLIETEGKRFFYSGDFRGHGRKSILFDRMIANPLKDIDYLLLEGSMIGRDSAAVGTEKDIENELVEQFKGSDDLFFIACSSQNIDRLVSIFNACARSNRIFVIDPYTALVLDRLKKVSSGLPQFDWGENIRIFFVPNNYTQKMADDGVLFKFKSAKIAYEEMQKSRNRLVIKDTFKLRTIFAKRKELSNTKLIYSMWDGYLAGIERFWKDNNVSIVKIHCSGHAYISELQAFVKAMNPKVVIPNHTFYPEKFASLFDKRVMMLKDGQTVDL
jgi:ribonuclease J